MKATTVLARGMRCHAYTPFDAPILTACGRVDKRGSGLSVAQKFSLGRRALIGSNLLSGSRHGGRNQAKLALIGDDRVSCLAEVAANEHNVECVHDHIARGDAMGDEAVQLDHESESYFELCVVGTPIWRLAEQQPD